MASRAGVKDNYELRMPNWVIARATLPVGIRNGFPIKLGMTTMLTNWVVARAILPVAIRNGFPIKLGMTAMVPVEQTTGTVV